MIEPKVALPFRRVELSLCKIEDYSKMTVEVLESPSTRRRLMEEVLESMLTTMSIFSVEEIRVRFLLKENNN